MAYDDWEGVNYIATYMVMNLDGNELDIEMCDKEIYLCSLLLILLGCDIKFHCFDDDEQKSSFSGRTIENVQDACNQIKGVKRLQTLCIHNIRQSMQRLTDECFQTLPLPSRLRKLLMLHDVSDVVCKAFQIWPELMPIEDLVSL